MNKQEFIESVAAKTNLSKKDAAASIDAYNQVVTETLAKGESITFVGFGAFSVAESAERQGRNPQTGDVVTIPASKRAKFKSGKALKDAVNK
jgi:DNA-binding protein HU-beta